MHRSSAGFGLSRSPDDKIARAVESKGLANTSVFIRRTIEQALGPRSALQEAEAR